VLEHHGPRKLQNMLIALKYLHGHPCVDCGESDVRVLDFDHRDPKAKHFSIGDALTRSTLSVEMLVDEIALCDIRCANCHRKKAKTWKVLSIEQLSSALTETLARRKLTKTGKPTKAGRPILRTVKSPPRTRPLKFGRLQTTRYLRILSWLDKYPPRVCEVE